MNIKPHQGWFMGIFKKLKNVQHSKTLEWDYALLNLITYETTDLCNFLYLKYKWTQHCFYFICIGWFASILTGK